MPQLKIIIKFNTSSVKKELDNNDNEIINNKHDINIEESITNSKNGKFSNLNNLGKKRKQ